MRMITSTEWESFGKYNNTNKLKLTVTIKPLEMCWLLLILLEEISRLIQDLAILWNEEISIPLMNLKLL